MEEIAPKDAADLVGVVLNARTYGIRLLPVGGGNTFSESWPGAFRRLDMSGIDNVIDIDHSNLCVRASAGVTVGDLHRQVESAGFLWHPIGYADASSTVGSVVSRNDGRRNLFFGTASDNLLGADAVLGNGNTIRMGGKMIKFQTGYSLHHSMAGAWGQLGALTNLILRLHPIPRSAILLQARADEGLDLALSLLNLPAAGVFPSGVDFRWHPTISCASAQLRIVGLSESEVSGIAAKGSKIIRERMGSRVEITTRQTPVSDACSPGFYQPWKKPNASNWSLSADAGAALQVVANLGDESQSHEFEVAGGVLDGTLSLNASPSLTAKAAVLLSDVGSLPIDADPRCSEPAPNSLLAFKRLKTAFDPDGIFPDWSSDR